VAGEAGEAEEEAEATEEAMEATEEAEEAEAPRLLIRVRARSCSASRSLATPTCLRGRCVLLCASAGGQRFVVYDPDTLSGAHTHRHAPRRPPQVSIEVDVSSQRSDPTCAAGTPLRLPPGVDSCVDAHVLAQSLTVVASYRGRGHIAETGFKWVRRGRYLHLPCATDHPPTTQTTSKNTRPFAQA
jgi:hypothetical protein